MGDRDIRDKLRSLGGLAGGPAPSTPAPESSTPLAQPAPAEPAAPEAAAPEPPATEAVLPAEEAEPVDLSGLITRRARITEDLQATASRLAHHLGLPADSEATFLVELADHLVSQPPTTPMWWSAENLDPVRSTLGLVHKSHRELDVLRGEIFDLAGEEWRSLPVVALEGDYGEEGLRLSQPDTLTAQNIGEHRRLITDVDRFTASIRRLALTFDAALHCEVESLTVGAMHRLTTALLTLSERPPPVARWADPAAVRMARATFEATAADLDAEAELRQEVARHFVEGIVEVDLPVLLVEVKGDIEQAAARLEHLTRPDHRPASVEAIYAATEWFEIRRALDAAASARDAMLGHLAQFPPDRPAIEDALAAIETVHESLGDQADSDRLRELIEYHGFEDSVLVGVARAIESEISVFARYCTKLGYVGLEELTLEQLQAWRHSAEENLDKLTGAVDALGDAAGSRPLGELVVLLQLRARIATAEDQLAEIRHDVEPVLGILPDDPRPSEWQQLATGIAWVGELREIYGGPIPQDAVARIHGVDEIEGASVLRELLAELQVVQGELDALASARGDDPPGTG